MKYKLCGGLICLFAIVMSLAAPLLENKSEARFHQHRDAPAKTADAAGKEDFTTHLPLIKIDTGGADIPGKAMYAEDGTLYFTKTPEGLDEIIAHMDVVDHEASYNHASDTPDVSTDIAIQVRDNASLSFEKSSYSIRLVNADGGTDPQPILGMDAHHEWVLDGPYLDKTLIRNYMWYNIGGELMSYSPNVRFCEVIINGVYRGVYLMTERIGAGENGARLDLTVNSQYNTFSGYLLQLNGQRPDGEHKALIEQFTFYTKRTPYKLSIEFPGRQELTEEMKQAIAKDFSDFERSIYSHDRQSDEYGYSAQIDVESFIYYFLINELTCNYDAGRLSPFIYKDRSGKFHMCLWDMNSACGNCASSQTEPMGFSMQDSLWYSMLLKDEKFTDSLIKRYRDLRKTYFDVDYLYRYIDEAAAYLGPAIDRNYEVWGDSLLSESDPSSYSDAIEQMKEFLSKRIAWMDENIDSLRQYSAVSKVKKLNNAS